MHVGNSVYYETGIFAIHDVTWYCWSGEFLQGLSSVGNEAREANIKAYIKFSGEYYWQKSHMKE
jgi:hypothetical protein